MALFAHGKRIPTAIFNIEDNYAFRTRFNTPATRPKIDGNMIYISRYQFPDETPEMPGENRQSAISYTNDVSGTNRNLIDRIGIDHGMPLMLTNKPAHHISYIDVGGREYPPPTGSNI